VIRTLALSALVLFGMLAEALAAPANIVAIGADNVAGRGMGKHYPGGVSASVAFPAQLEGLLRAQGIDAHVTNAGIPGGTTADIVSQLDSSVPDGTQLVILDLARGNDKKRGNVDDQADHVAEIRSRLSARHIALFVLPRWQRIPGAVENRDPDGHHFTAEGHARIAAFLLPRVMRILGDRAHRSDEGQVRNSLR
jgi:acyl-CoA thioesterase-1